MSLISINQVTNDIPFIQLNTSKENKKVTTLPATIDGLDFSNILQYHKLILFGGFSSIMKRMENSRIAPYVKL